jgi:hypothetical protein
MNDFEKNMYQEIRMLREKFSIMKLENTKLKAQLRWRPTTEKPEKAGLYWCELLDNETGSVHYNLCQYVGGWLGRYQVIRYVPIPPVPEGEPI